MIEDAPVRSAATGGPHDRLRRVLRVAGPALVVAVLGASASAHTTVVVGAVMIVAALPLLNGRPTTWIALAIATPWTSRILTTGVGAPRFFDFLDFALVLIAFLFATLRFLGTDRRLPLAQRRICRWLAAAACVILLSWAFNDVGEPQRLLAGWVLALEPFLLLTAVLVTPMTVREHRFLVVLIGVLLCGQAAFSTVDILLGLVTDDVKGTLFGAGAGHHVSAGGLAVGFFLVVRQRVPKLLAMGFGALALFIMIVADAKQVLFALPPALLVLGIAARRTRSLTSLVGGALIGILLAGASVYALTTYQASLTAVGFVDRATENKTGKFAVADALWDDLTTTAPRVAFGLGPGQSVSRFAFLTTPALFKDGSPVALLGLSVSRGAEHYDDIAFSGPFTGNSSFTAAQSSILGVLGDYGLGGVVAFGALIGAVLSALRRAPDRALAGTALASWTLLIPLALVFDWLEQPPFTLPIMVLSGLAMRAPRDPTADDAATDRTAGSPPATSGRPEAARS